MNASCLHIKNSGDRQIIICFILLAHQRRFIFELFTCSMNQSMSNDPQWLGPKAYWYKNRDVRRAVQERHVNSAPNDSKWEACKMDYYERNNQSIHIPPRVYNTLMDTSRQPSQTLFLRYGWVSSCNDYEMFAETYPDEYAYELWFGHRGLSRASMDARNEHLASFGSDVDATSVTSDSEKDDISNIYSDQDMQGNVGDDDLFSFEMNSNDMIISKDLVDDEFDTF